MSNLAPQETYGQLGLFDQPRQAEAGTAWDPAAPEPARSAARGELEGALQGVRDRFGDDAVQWGTDAR